MTDDVDHLRSELDAVWRRGGVALDDRRELAEEVVLDLRAASADGRDPRSLLTPDLATFARRVADERRAPRVLPAWGRLLAGGLAGAALAFVLGVRPVLALFSALAGEPTSDRDVGVVAALLVWSALAAFCLGGALLGLGLALRGSGRVRPTLWRAAVLLPVTGVGAALGTVAYARSTGYRTDGTTVLLELALVVGSVAAALAVARAWAVRGALDRPAPPASDGPA